MHNILLPLLICLVAQISIAQLSISGKIVDEAGTSLTAVNLAVLQVVDSSFVKGTISNMDGSFAIQLQKSADYTLQLSFVGFKDKAIQVSKSADLGTIRMQTLTEQLDDVVVTAQRPMIQRMQDKLIVNVEGSILSTGNNTLEVLAKSPGIIVDQDDNLSMNGRSGLRIYLDNKDTRLQGDQLANLLRSMPAASIDRIELISNPSAKYEAAGNAGIINIISKKGKLYGTNGSLTISPGLGRYFRWENGITFNHRADKWNLYGQYTFAKRNQYMEIVIDRIFLENGQVVSRFDLQNDFRLPIENHMPRLGLDFNPSEQTTVGIVLSGLANFTGMDAFSDILEFNPENSLIGQQQTDNKTDANWHQFVTNLNARHLFSNKSSLDFNVDYARYTNGDDQVFASQFLDPTQTIIAQNKLLGDIGGYFNLLGLALDYELPFNNGSKLELGWKNTWVKTDNNLQYQDEINGQTSTNNQFSNHFIYDEAIYAAYLNYNITKPKWNASLGLRGEQTKIIGNQLTTQTSFDNAYFNLFPSASLNYTANPDHIFGVSVSRRLDRPSYNDLNPFRFFVNTNTFRVGNPFLTPQFTWAVELNYTLKKRYYFALNYGYTIDNLNRAIVQEGDDQVVVVKPINIDNLKSLSFVASVPVQFAPWWNSQWNFNMSFNDFKGVIAGFEFDRVNPVYVLNTNHSISVGKGYSIQLGGFYLPPHRASITDVRTISQVSFGIRKNILNNKGSIRFNINDIFYNQYPRGRTVFGNIDDTFLSFRDTRYGTLSFNLNFGKQSIKAQRRRGSKVQDELNRARRSEN